MADNQKIIAFLRKRPDGATLSEISVHTGHGRATIGKYLELLKAEGKADFRGVGMAKVWFLSEKKMPIVLIVDDEPGILRLLRLTLGEKNHEIIEASDGITALEKINEHMPDLVILDLMLPKLDGMEVCKRVKENALTRKIPVLMLTAKDELRSRVKGVTLGADDYVAKPFDIAELRERVKTLLHKETERNPVTNLPNRTLLNKKISEMKGSIGIIKVSFQNLDKYSREKGKLKENEFLRIASQIIAHSIQPVKNSLAGHASDDLFIVVVPKENTKRICESLKSSFGEVMPYIDADKRSEIRAEIEAIDADQTEKLI